MRRRDFLASSAQVAFGLGLLPVLGCSSTRKPNNSANRRAVIADLEAQLPKLMEQHKVPGLSIVVIQDGKMVWRRGFGVRDNDSKQPVDNDTVFEAGSMSKPVFAYRVLKLCEMGVLDLDTPLTRYASERLLEGDPRLDLITARHVLSHTSGFQNWRSRDKALTIHFKPGEQFRYSGEGYFYLQSVVTHLTGNVDRSESNTYEAGVKVYATDFDSYMKANVLLPFGMSSSSYLWNETLIEHAARPHDPDGKPLVKKKPSRPNVARYGSAGGLHATPTDYAKFLIEVINPKRTDAYRLKKESLEEMVRPHVKTNEGPGGSWALGWQVPQPGIIGHGGYNTGFHSYAMASRKGNCGYVVMTNGDGAGEIIKTLWTEDWMGRLMSDE
jgi:CubicO group peptidase (beta-lactamase class C family)